MLQRILVITRISPLGHGKLRCKCCVMKGYVIITRFLPTSVTLFHLPSQQQTKRSMTSENENIMSTESVEAVQESGGNGWFDFGNWWQWKPTSNKHLVQAESRMLEFVETPLEKKFVKLASGHEVWTISANTNFTDKTPMVMIHGFAGGIGLWSLNLDELSRQQPLYAFDLLGFGRSSRPTFDSDPAQAEEMFVESIEQWREAVKLDKMVLLGHSFGGYLASSYALKYPDRVKRLLLVDPWGFPARDPNSENARRIPFWIRALVVVLSPFNPLAPVRAAGPWGLGLVKKLRADFKNRYPKVSEKNEDTVFEYIYHCNAGLPSGERAFKQMNEYLGYSYSPMLERIGEMRHDVPVVFIYGARSWMDINSGRQTQNLLPNNHVEVYSVKGAGHHVYADRPTLFHEIVNTVCDSVD